MPVQFLLDRAAEDPSREALVWAGTVYSYGWLLDRVEHWQGELSRRGVSPGTVTMLEGDYSPNSIAMLLALLAHRCIVVPLTEATANRTAELTAIAEGETAVRIDGDDEPHFAALGRRSFHPLYEGLRTAAHPGLVLFSSGSTGRSKAALHDVASLLEKYHARRHTLRTLAFLMYDHIGGIDTLFYVLSNTSCLVTVPDRRPDTVCAAVAQYRVDVLPASPSFLNLLLLSQAYKHHDLRSLQYITYGAEVMPESTLQKTHAVFPGVKLLQKFGTTEVGTLRSQSRAPDSTWIRMGGEGYAVRVVDGILQIKARSAIVGYLNAPSPFTEDGWFITGDLVEVDGEYMRILGRDSELINVGGEKVNPVEVENAIAELDFIREAAVYPERNPLVGNIVCAKVSLWGEKDPREAVRRIKHHCAERLERHKAPVKIEVVDYELHSERFKKMRRLHDGEAAL